MEAVLGSRSAQLRPGQGAGYYAQSWALTSYFLSTPERRELLKRYLGAVMDGAEPVAALEGTVGRTPAQLQNDVRLYLTRISFATLRQDFPAVEVSVTRMPRSARELVWLDLRLDRTSGEAEDAELLTRIRGIAANYPDDRLAAVVLAKAELHAENWSAAQAALASLIGEGSSDAEALRLAAVARMKRGDAEGLPEADRDALYREARSLLARANRAAPTDFRVYMALADSREGQPGYPNDNDLNILLAAAEYAPQVTGTRFRAAQALVNQEIYLQAIELLAPMANNPHGGAAMQPVRALLAEARENAGLAPAHMAAPEVDEAEEAAPPADD